jgi:hypothetical protein
MSAVPAELLKLLDSIGRSIADFCTLFVRRTPDPPDSPRYRQFLRTYDFSHTSILKLIQQSSSLLSLSLSENYILFCNLFPQVDVSSSSKPESNQIEHPLFTDFIDPFVWQAPIHRSTLVFALSKIKSLFLCELLSQHTPPATSDEVTTIITSIIQNYLSFPLTEDCYSNVLLEISHAWSFVIHDISLTHWLLCLEQLTLFVVKSGVPPIVRASVFTLFSSALVRGETPILHKLLGCTYIVMRDPDPELHRSAAEIIVSLLAQAILTIPSLVMDIPRSIVLSLHELKTPVALAALGALSTFLDVKDMRTLEDYIQVGLGAKDEQLPGFLKGLAVKMMGRRFITFVESERTHANYKWKVENGRQVHARVIDFLLKRCTKNAFGQSELSKIIENLAILSLEDLTAVLPRLGGQLDGWGVMFGCHCFLANCEFYHSPELIPELKNTLVTVACDLLARVPNEMQPCQYGVGTTFFTVDLNAAPRPAALARLILKRWDNGQKVPKSFLLK